MTIHFKVRDISNIAKRIKVNGKIDCLHDNYSIETDEEITHPDDPHNGKVTKYAVCDECGRQGILTSKDEKNINWETL